MSGLKIVFGGYAVQSDQTFANPTAINELFAVLKKHKVTTLDTAEIYGDSEALLGSVDAGKQFTLDTKAPGGFRAGTDAKGLYNGAEAALKRLQTSQVDIFYLHCPDDSVPLEETLSGIDKIHKAGLFKRFGLSNYKADDVRKVFDLAKSKGYVLPSVYQGNYSPIARLQETLLFPTLRELGIAFYAYSPVAGGFLAKTRAQIEQKEGRFDPSTMIGKMYSGMYAKPTYLDALGEWNAIANEVGCSGAELANRWVAFESPLSSERGDAVIIGGRNVQQIESTLEGIEHGRLPKSAVERIDAIWEKIKHEAPLDNFHK